MAKQGTTRWFSDIQEKSVCKLLGSQQVSNSGAGSFRKGDCVHRSASLLIECKTVVTEKESVSIKKEWLTKNKEEAFTQRLSNGVIAFNFGPNQPNYFVIDEKMMKFLTEKLEEENN
jgi:hypothetical protein